MSAAKRSSTPSSRTASSTAHPRRRPVPRRALRTSVRVLIIVVLGVPLLVGTAAASGFGALLFGSLPGTVPPENPTIVSQPSYVYDVNGQQIATFRQFDLSIPMTKEDIPQVLKDAVVAAEDRKFWTHKGIDPEGLVRAAITNYREGSTVQGGSTISSSTSRTPT
jgi:membrane peptidoglycan carboxypeptidase